MAKVQMLLTVFLLTGLFVSCDGQLQSKAVQTNTPLVGGPCDGCELMYEGMPDTISFTDTSAGWYEAGQKLLITGTIFKHDGKTPAPGVMLYYYHTDNNGYYLKAAGKGNGTRHGHLRGWVKSDSNGRYNIYTIRPAPYPNSDMPAHIHPVIKEPDMPNEYYTDEWVFDDDTLLTTAKRNALENRGGSGIMRIQLSNELQVAEHDIVLGLHIPNYPR